MFKPSKDKAQSTVEYIILVTAVVMVAIAYMATNGSLFQRRMTNTMDTLSVSMTNAAARLSNTP